MKRFFWILVAVFLIVGCGLKEKSLTPTPQMVRETVVPQVVKETVVVEKEVVVEVTRVVEKTVLVTQTVEVPALTFGPTSGTQVVMGGVQTLDDIRALGIPVLTDWPETAEAFHARATRGQPVWRRGDPWLPIELGEIRVPVGESLGWAVPREKGRFEEIVPFWVHNTTPFTQDGWMHFEEDRNAFGRSGDEYEGSIPGSGVPSGFRGWVGGYTERPFDIDALHRIEDSQEAQAFQPFGPTAVQPTATPVAQAAPTAQATVAPATPVPTVVPVTEWSLERVRELFKLDASVTLELCGPCCVKAPPQAAFQVTNPFNQWVDGYRINPGVARPGYTDPKVGIPPQSTEMVEAATFWCQ